VLGLFKLLRRVLEGSILSAVLLGVVAVFGASPTIDLLIADASPASLLFLLVSAIVLADIIARAITIVDNTFPDLLPKYDEEERERASLISRLRPGRTVALLSGAAAARIFLFLALFALLAVSYAIVPAPVQATLFGDLTTLQATETFLREGVAGSIGYFLFFLGPQTLEPITSAVAGETRLESSTLDGAVFLAGIRLYGFAFVLAILRTLATPITYLRARLRAQKIAETEERAATA